MEIEKGGRGGKQDKRGERGEAGTKRKKGIAKVAIAKEERKFSGKKSTLHEDAFCEVLFFLFIIFFLPQSLCTVSSNK